MEIVLRPPKRLVETWTEVECYWNCEDRGKAACSSVISTSAVRELRMLEVFFVIFIFCQAIERDDDLLYSRDSTTIPMLLFLFFFLFDRMLFLFFLIECISRDPSDCLKPKHQFVNDIVPL